MSRLPISLLLSLVGLLFSGLALGAPPSVIIHGEAEVSGETIWLSDIATIQGGEDPQALFAALARVSLGPAPKPGSSRTLSQGAITTRIRGAIGDVPTIVPAKVTVTRASDPIPLEEVEDAVIQWAEERLNHPDGVVTLEDISLDGAIPAPTHHQGFRVQGASRALVSGAMSMDVILLLPGGVTQRIPFTARLIIDAPVVIVARPISRGTSLSDDDLRVEMRQLERGPLPIMDPEAALGLLTTRALKAGLPLMERDVAFPPDVMEGDPITLVIRSGSLKITVPGEAKADGRIGELISVYCPSTRRLLRGEVLEAGIVELHYLSTSQIPGDRR